MTIERAMPWIAMAVIGGTAIASLAGTVAAFWTGNSSWMWLSLPFFLLMMSG